MSNAFSHISNPGLLTPETPEIVTLKFGRINPRRPYDRRIRTTIIAIRITLGIIPKHYPEHYPGHYPRERIGRIDRI